MSLFKTKHYSKPEPVKTVYGGRKKELEKNIIKGKRNLFLVKSANQAIKFRVIRDIRTLFEQEEKYHYKRMTASNFGNNNYIEYENSDDRNKNLSVKECSNKIKPYFRDIITNLQTSDIWKC